MVFDSSRKIDDNGNLIIKRNVLTSEGVVDYLGCEIPDFEELGLDPNKHYAVYRPLSVIEEAKDTFNNLPLLKEHEFVSPESLPKDRIIGTVGQDAVIDGIDLVNSLVVWRGDAISEIESGAVTGLSCGYTWSIDKAPEGAVFNGKKYDFIVKKIQGNHLALVKQPRVATAIVGDSRKGEPMGWLFNRTGKSQDALPDEAEILRIMAEGTPEEKEALAKMVAELTKKPEPAMDEPVVVEPAAGEALTAEAVAMMISEAVNKLKEELVGVVDAKELEKAQAMDSAERLGLGRVVGSTETILKSILTHNGIACDSMSIESMKGAVSALVAKAPAKQTTITFDSASGSGVEIDERLTK